MSTIWRFLIAFLALTGATVLAAAFGGIAFGRSNFWEHHGLIFLVFIAFFPRLTLLLSDVASGGLLWWLGWLFAPRILVALLATFAYWIQNPILVVIAWLIAVGGESSEKFVVINRGGSMGGFRKGSNAKWVDAEVAPADHHKIE